MSLWSRIYAERRAILLPVIVLLGLNAAVLLLGVLPLERSVVSAAQGATDARMELGNARRLEMFAKAQRDGKQRADVELDKFYGSVLPTSFAGAVDVTNYWLEGVARDAGVAARSGQWEPERVRDSRLTALKGQVTLTGDYAEIRKFLYDVETAEQFVIIESVELSQASTSEATGVIELALAVTTYFLTPADVEARPK